MRRIIVYMILFFCVFVVYGAVESDTLKVYFSLDNTIYNPSLNNNASSMDKFIDSLNVSSKTGDLDHISVYGYASPEGPMLNNVRLSKERTDVIADYISHHSGIPLSLIRKYPGDVDWDGLRTLVINTPATPSREEIIHVLDRYLPTAKSNNLLSEECRKVLMAIDKGYPYQWMLENLFPKLRYSLAIFTFNIPERIISLPYINNIESCPLRVDILEKIEVLAPLSSIRWIKRTYPPYHQLAVKTNFLYDLALLPNLEVEWLFNRNWSVALEGGVAWWGNYDRQRSYRLVEFTPEVKRWINPRAPWHGLYIGIMVGGGYYDFEVTGRGYRGEGGLIGPSVGYMWPISRNLSLEAEFGAGYLYTKCKKYKPLDGHHVYQLTKNIHYFGPIRAKFSLVWRLWDRNKSRNKKLEMLTEETVVQYEK